MNVVTYIMRMRAQTGKKVLETAELAETIFKLVNSLNELGTLLTAPLIFNDAFLDL